MLGPVGTAPFTHLVAQRTRIVEHAGPAGVGAHGCTDGAVVADFGAVVAATPDGHVPPRRAGRHGQAARRVPARSRRPRLDDPRAPGHRHELPSTPSAPAPQTFRPFGYLAFRYLEVDAPGEPLGAPTSSSSTRGTRAMPDTPDDGDVPHVEPDARRGVELAAHSALYVAQEQFLDTPTREKGQFLADSFDESQATMRAFGEQNLTRQALRDFAQLAGALLARRPAQRRLPERRRPARHPRLHRAATSNGSGSTTCRPATARPLDGAATRSCARVADYVARARSTRRPGS